MNIPNINNILDASERIKQYINKTPILTSTTLNEMFDCQLFFKCENFQKVGAFKFRGASNSVFSLSDEEAKKGVATHSSGNHAQALALAGKLRGIPATIVMPVNSPKVKRKAVEGYGGKIIFCEPTLISRETTLNTFAKNNDAIIIHPYDNFNVISGQGTAALELIKEYKDLDYIIAPVGGGGLLSGTSIAVSSLSPSTKVIAAEPEGADDAYRSIDAGKILPSIAPKTIADGLLTSLCDLTFEIIKNNVSQIVTVKESSIIKAMRLIWERMKIVVEPSAAVPLGILIDKKIDLSGKRIGIILSGGNVDLDTLPWIK